MIAIFFAGALSVGAHLADVIVGIGKRTNEIDLNQARAALNGSSPFDEQSLEPDAHGPAAEETPAAAAEETPTATADDAPNEKERVAVIA